MNPFAGNPHSVAIKRYLFEVLKERYARNERYIERVAASTLVREDYEGLSSLVADLFEAGFMRALDQYKEQIAKMGLRVDVVPSPTPAKGDPIFRED
jgi:hypothetical protein